MIIQLDRWCLKKRKIGKIRHFPTLVCFLFCPFLLFFPLSFHSFSSFLLSFSLDYFFTVSFLFFVLYCMYMYGPVQALSPFHTRLKNTVFRLYLMINQRILNEALFSAPIVLKCNFCAIWWWSNSAIRFVDCLCAYSVYV